MVAGGVAYEGGQFNRVDRESALRELHESPQRALADDEVERRALSKALLLYVRRFYAGYSIPRLSNPTTARARGPEVPSRGAAEIDATQDVPTPSLIATLHDGPTATYSVIDSRRRFA
jgi:hypothetical protein